MLRRFGLILLRRAFLVLLLICLGCSAQSNPSSNASVKPGGPTINSEDLARVIERQVRDHYSIPPEVKISMGTPRASEFPNYDAVTITIDGGTKKQDLEFLLSHDHKTLLRLTHFDLTNDPYAARMKKIDVTGRPMRGNKDAKVTIVNFDDLECPFCSEMHGTLFPEILKEYGDRVLFIYKDYPLDEIHPWAVHAAVDANCLAAQNGDAYWDYVDYLHANQHQVSDKKARDSEYGELDRLAAAEAEKHKLDSPKLLACLKAQDDRAVRASIKEGESLNIDATPTMFVNGQKLDGALPAENVRTVLDQALKDAGVAPPPHPQAPPAGNGSPPPPAK
jgi:protein-disulfide isomerase